MNWKKVLFIPIILIGIFYTQNVNAGIITAATGGDVKTPYYSNYVIFLGSGIQGNNFNYAYIEIYDDSDPTRATSWWQFVLAECLTNEYASIPDNCLTQYIAYNNATFSTYKSVTAFKDDSNHYIELDFSYYKKTINGGIGYTNLRASTSPITLSPNKFYYLYITGAGGASGYFQLIGFSSILTDYLNNFLSCSTQTSTPNDGDCDPVKTPNFVLTDINKGFSETGLIYGETSTSTTGIDLLANTAFCDSQFSTAGSFLSWSGLGNGICKSLAFLFVPSVNVIGQFTSLPNKFYDKAPFSLFRDSLTFFDNLLSTTTATTTINASTTIMGKANINIYFDFKRAVDTLPLLGTIRDLVGNLLYVLTVFILFKFVVTIL